MVVSFDPDKVFWGIRGNHATLYNKLYDYLDQEEKNKSILRVFFPSRFLENFTRIPCWDWCEYKIPDDFNFNPKSLTNNQKIELVSLYLKRFGDRITKNGFYRSGSDRCLQPDVEKLLSIVKEQKFNLLLEKIEF